jgi:hypothetical protein
MAMRRESVFRVVGVIVATALATGVSALGQVVKAPVDPGVRGGAPGGGSPLVLLGHKKNILL